MTMEIPQKTVKKHRQNIVAYKKVQEPLEEVVTEFDIVEPWNEKFTKLVKQINNVDIASLYNLS